MSIYLSQGSILCWKRTLRAEPCETLHATDAYPSGAGGFFASITREAWLALNEMAEEKRKHGRLDWKCEEPPSNMHDVRAAAAPLAQRLKWTTLFSYRVFASKHINLLELKSRISLLRRIAREGMWAPWCLPGQIQQMPFK